MRKITPPMLKELATFKVQLQESRVLTCYLGAKSRAGAVRETMKAWRLRKIDPASELPFEVSLARIAKPVEAQMLAPAKPPRGR